MPNNDKVKRLTSANWTREMTELPAWLKPYLMNKPETIEDFPFGADVSVFKVKGKMFATLAWGQDKAHYWMNLKCDPNEALALRDIFSAVIPGYHMNKIL